MMKKLFIYTIFLSLFLGVKAQDYTNGIFILNEDWFGHNNSTINFLNPETGEFDYLILQGNADNAGASLGCTAQFGTIYGNNLYVISKQDQDPGETNPVSGGRIVVADAKTLKVKKRIPVIFEINGKSAADGRGFVGVNENKGYVGTSNGIFVMNLSNFQIERRIEGTENPLISGGESNADGVGPLYNNQIGMMCRTSDYVFAIQQDKGVLVIDPESDTVIKVINGCYSTLTQSKDGTVWVGKNSNMSYQQYPYGTVGENWDGNQLLKINPNTLATEIINMSAGAGINQTWYAWTAGSLCASAKENALYFAYNESDWNWFTTSKMYRYDIDNNEFTLIYDSENEERYFYGASLRINPLDDKIYAALYLDNINQTYFIYQLDNSGNLLKTFEPIKRYWFPAMFIFPDNYSPEVSQLSSLTLNNTQPVTINLKDMASDRDNLSAAITKNILTNDNEDILSASIKNNVLTLTAKEGKSGTARIIVRFNSNGKTVDRVQEVIVSTTSNIDETSPTIPTNLVAIPTETSITLSWTASTDNIGVEGYIVYLDGDSIETVSETNFNVTGLTSGTEYTLAVEAFDEAGNKSGKAEVTVATLAIADNIAPTTPEKIEATPAETSIALSWTASTDNIGVEGYIVYLDGDSIETVSETSFTVTGLSPGTDYLLAVEAFDAAGNKSGKVEIDIPTSPVIDNEVPTAPTNLVAVPSDTSIAFSWTASTDNVGVLGYAVYLDGVLISTVNQTNLNVTGLSSDTEYTLAVGAFDASSNESVLSEITVSTTTPADKTAPSAPTNLIAEASETSIVFSWSASTDDVGVAAYNIYLNGDSIDNVTETNFTLTELSPGTEYTFSVEAVDAAGNKSERITITQSTIITGIESLNNNKLTVFPNPFSSFIIIKSAKNQQVLIYDVSGKVVMRIGVEAGITQINTSEIKKGVYLVSCGTDTFKLIK
ncbi:DUF5074 domain-containing protein [Maribellus comscasis]|uniref:DUF5074 domain-containing protein n=1 Tax=Maribellus comscasis TaxID=2681766 RepID=A0A6I6K157_9BACT|nr:DUF5074 domain-containing protein [Maribellus comscasis]QGY46287.1 DUF5074 domain-containing protein [Maribellus comscasis]